MKEGIFLVCIGIFVVVSAVGALLSLISVILKLMKKWIDIDWLGRIGLSIFVTGLLGIVIVLLIHGILLLL